MVLDRAPSRQRLPVIAAGGCSERRRDGDETSAAYGEDPVELGETQVITNGQPELDPVHRRGDDLLARLLVLGLAVGDATGLHIEHMDLAVNGKVISLW